MGDPVQTPPLYPPQTYSQATASLVCGIIGIVLIVVCFPVSLILGILGLAMGLGALNTIKNNPGKYKGRSLATAGMVLGAVNIVVPAILIVFFLMATMAPI